MGQSPISKDHSVNECNQIHRKCSINVDAFLQVEWCADLLSKLLLPEPVSAERSLDTPNVFTYTVVKR